MGYLFLALSLLACTTKGYCGKKMGNVTKDAKDAMAVNFVRMLLCIVIGIVLILAAGDGRFLAPSWIALGTMALSGLFTSSLVVFWLLSVKRTTYMTVEVFLMMGVLVPVLISTLFLGEPFSYKDGIGIALLIAATLVMCYERGTTKKKLTASTLLLLVITGLSNGTADLSQRLFTRVADGTPASVFNFYTYVFSAATLLPLLLVLERGSVPAVCKRSRRVLSLAAIYMVVMAACLFATSYFKTLAAPYLTSTELYPLSQGGSLILATLMSAVLLRERLTVRAVIGIAVAFLGLLFINVL